MKQTPLLEINDLKTHFHTDRGKVTAVGGVSFSMDRGEIIGIVGESGCGKSVMSQSILRLLEHTDSVEYEGEVLFEGENLLAMPLPKLRAVRGNEISMIFQDPLTSLNPVYTIGNQIEEALRLHRKLSRKEARKKAIEILGLTGIPSPETRVDDYPHQLSGGMQQRAMIAMALACEPKLLIADEPTTALDVTIQAQILELITELNRTLGMGVLFITHDLGVVSEICTGVKVMYLGRIVEETTTERLFRSPLHPYTQGLLQSIPKLEGDRREKLHVIEGTVPSLSDIPRGCGFSTRCPYADEKCRSEDPVMAQADERHRVKCWHYEKINRLTERRSGDGEAVGG
ncbi:ABC transporter ATP-binding protein [Cohnella cellulosilytica]|uniref:ABC transporter ATP-binding protein n=1 Tax=Cohnella cellulosilytica TaxID=986710 RepID=A0ABW2F7Y2_9BACL